MHNALRTYLVTGYIHVYEFLRKLPFIPADNHN